ncbi:hypothetical protein GLOTRDRAFT_131777 [Gloeophyllum trabeum ATCC 11539]|uniref:Uncharacterized protein n=1 Tax=Gloeophyllum trabeum (strain ATCC 11539 / FP-39264 / Madison 617) TaxID=670483 RepID=S7PY38_GLOTA|nr:uncharacterized protein GLOTRDRAFT_131777 [Gloeophyllum trabeum ATCC 11539]EPQ52541.1 hypothetical protein GLOTRDRAFT_131777 [Gloeophyllum trabeum ATCC 11539]
MTPIEGDALVAGLKDSKFNDMASLLGQIPASDLTGFLSLLTGNVTLLLPSSSKPSLPNEAVMVY